MEDFPDDASVVTVHDAELFKSPPATIQVSEGDDATAKYPSNLDPFEPPGDAEIDIDGNTEVKPNEYSLDGMRQDPTAELL
jgi:hypothetical protein